MPRDPQPAGSTSCSSRASTQGVHVTTFRSAAFFLGFCAQFFPCLTLRVLSWWCSVRLTQPVSLTGLALFLTPAQGPATQLRNPGALAGTELSGHSLGTSVLLAVGRHCFVAFQRIVLRHKTHGLLKEKNQETILLFLIHPVISSSLLALRICTSLILCLSLFSPTGSLGF